MRSQTEPTGIFANQILVTRDGQNSWSIQWGDVRHDHLTWEEMLGEFASLTLTGRSRFPITTEFPNNQSF